MSYEPDKKNELEKWICTKIDIDISDLVGDEAEVCEAEKALLSCEEDEEGEAEGAVDGGD